jgi:hypothetical protein
MSYEIAAICQTSSAPFPFWPEMWAIFVGDVLAVLFVTGTTSFLWYLVKYPGFRVGANWIPIGWDIQEMKRLPNESDAGNFGLMPNISVTSYDMNVKKVITVVRVTERADPSDPGEIHGVLYLSETMTVDARTTGGVGLLKLTGPRIMCQGGKFRQIFHSPIFIETSDGEFYQAESPGNAVKGIAKLRQDIQKIFYSAKQRILIKLR